MAQIPGSPRTDQYLAAEGQTVFTYTFEIYSDEEVIVTKNDAGMILPTEYTVQNAGNPSGGTITLVTGATLDDVITITGNSYIERDTTFTNGGDFLASAINGEYDRLDNIAKEIVTREAQSFHLESPSAVISTVIPKPSAGKCVKWNVAEDAFILSTYDPDESVGNAEHWAEEAEISAIASAASAVVSEGYADDSLDYSNDSATDASASEVSALASAQSAADAAASAASINLTDLASDIVPSANDTWVIGTAIKRFKDVHAQHVYADDLAVAGAASAQSLDINGTNIQLKSDGDIATVGDISAPTGTVYAGLGLDVNSGLASISGTTGNIVTSGYVVGNRQCAQFKYITDPLVGGGTYTTPNWMQRPINTTVHNTIPGCSLDLVNNVIWIPAGRYLFSCVAFHRGTGMTTYHLRDWVTSAILGTWQGVYGNTARNSYGQGYFEMPATQRVEIAMKATITQLTTGMGYTDPQAIEDNTFLDFMLEKL
jgi:hypothetical protein